MLWSFGKERKKERKDGRKKGRKKLKLSILQLRTETYE